MPLVSLEYPPGLYRNGVERDAEGRYSDAALVRWREGVFQPMKGWTPFATGITGNPRNIHAWTDGAFASHVAVGTDTGLHTISGGVRSDRTGVGFFAASDGVWTVDSIGETFVGVFDGDDEIWAWTANSGGVAAPLANAPTASAVVVTQEQFVVALGAGGNPRTVRTSNLRQPTVWTPLSTNQAREVTLQTQGQLMGGARVRGGTLLFTSEDLHLMTYTGASPNYHRYDMIPGSRGVVSRNAMVAVDTRCYFMGPDSFYVYNGFTEPLPCDVQDDIFTSLNRSAMHKVQTFHNPDHQEVWWLYPRGSETENSHYVIFHYGRPNHWNHGEIDRACGIGPEGGFDVPLMCEGGTVYSHETGSNYDGRQWFVRGGPLELGLGDVVAECDMFIPDELTAGDAELYFLSRFYPNDVEYRFPETGAFLAANPQGVRISGRQISPVWQGATPDARIGQYRANVVSSGER